jgi:hypothetical protein
MFRENRHNKDGQHAQAVPKNFDFGDSNVLVDVLAGTSHGDGLWSSDRARSRANSNNTNP